jgi:porin
MVNLMAGLNTEKAGLWKGGRFFFNISNTHPGQPSGELIGDFQVVSNIEAGNHTYIQEMWFSQEIGPVNLTGGLQDLNVEFANTENGGLYLNSSFGIIPTISCNVPAPIFPLTALGLSVNWKISEETRWLAAIYDGSPTDFEDNPYNVRWELNADGGTLLISELQHSMEFNSNPGTYKVGLYTHHHTAGPIEESGDTELIYKTNFGFYAIADQTLWKSTGSNRNLGMFVQLGLTPKRYNFNHFYTGMGLNYSGLLNRYGDDMLGIAIAHAGLKGNNGNETTVELTYRVPITKNIFIQPDIQYIINPAGTEEKPEDCLAVIFRLGINF